MSTHELPDKPNRSSSEDKSMAQCLGVTVKQLKRNKIEKTRTIRFTQQECDYLVYLIKKDRGWEYEYEKSMMQFIMMESLGGNERGRMYLKSLGK